MASLVVVALSPFAFWFTFYRASARDAGGVFDAIVVPGGGITPAGDANEWVKGRLDRALELYEANKEAYIILLSRGTPHKPPPLDADGTPVDEAYVSAEYLRERNVPAERLLQDTWSLDTIGNALFLRLMHLEPRRLRRVVIITNDFHMPRLEAIFNWVHSLPPVPTRFALTFVPVPDSGLTDEQLHSRRTKEAASLEKLQVTISNIRTMEQLHAFIFERHGSYATGIPKVKVNKELAASY